MRSSNICNHLEPRPDAVELAASICILSYRLCRRSLPRRLLDILGIDEPEDNWPPRPGEVVRRTAELLLEKRRGEGQGRLSLAAEKERATREAVLALYSALVSVMEDLGIYCLPGGGGR